MTNLFENTAGEMTVSYKTRGKLPSKVNQSNDAALYLLDIWSEHIEYREEFRMILLNRKNQMVADSLISIGGITATVVDVRMICQAALLANACGVILAHNHPSGNLLPSAADREITEKIKQALNLFDIKLLDHIILTKNRYTSFNDEGYL